MRKILVSFFIFLILISLVSAPKSTLGTFKKGENISLMQLCESCTYNNISSVKYPNGSIILKDVIMTKIGIEYNYTLNDTLTQDIGTYVVSGYGDLDGSNTLWAYEFEVNAIGLESTEARTESANRGVYVVFAVAALLFVGFLFLPKDKTKTDEMGNLVYGGNNRPFKWTFFLLSVLFLSLGLNLTFISIYNEVGDTQIGAIYDKLAAISLYLFWFCFGLLLFLWIFTVLASLGDKKRMRQAASVGQPIDFNKY